MPGIRQEFIQKMNRTRTLTLNLYFLCCKLDLKPSRHSHCIWNKISYFTDINSGAQEQFDNVLKLTNTRFCVYGFTIPKFQELLLCSKKIISSLLFLGLNLFQPTLWNSVPLPGEKLEFCTLEEVKDTGVHSKCTF